MLLIGAPVKFIRFLKSQFYSSYILQYACEMHQQVELLLRSAIGIVGCCAGRKTIDCPKGIGGFPPLIVVVTLFVVELIRETTLSPLYATYTFVPAAVTPHGQVFTGTVAVTLFVTVSITETLLL